MIVRSRHTVAVLVAAALGVSAPSAALAEEALVAETPAPAPLAVEFACDAIPTGESPERLADATEAFGASEPAEAPLEGSALAPDESEVSPGEHGAADEPAVDVPDAPDADGDTIIDVNQNADGDAGIDADVEAGIETDSEAGSETDPEPDADTDVAPEPDADTDADADAGAEPVPVLIGWVTQDGKLYYYGSDGTALLGERYLDGAWYYFDPLRGGAAATGFVRVPIAEGSGSFKTSYFDTSGKRVAGLQTIGSERYFFDDNGALTLGFVERGDDVDYFDPDDGAMQTGQQYIHGDWRNFGDDGAMSTGFTTVSDGGSGSKTVYYDEFDGAMQYGERPIDGSWYLFDTSTGAMKTGWQWVESGNKITYYGTDGRRYSGECVIDGYRRYFDPATGAVDKYGFQNPLGYYQVSSQNVSLPSWQYATGFGYVTPSRIDVAATREDCVNAFIARAYEYIGTPYIWDYALAPGVGVDCAGLVLQCLYATGMDMGWYTPYDHYYTPGHDQYANAMASDPKFMHVSFADRQRGDLIFYEGHVGIYLGNDQIIDAYPDGRGVQVRSLWHMTPNYVVARPFV